jgi:hypothetical protein
MHERRRRAYALLLRLGARGALGLGWSLWAAHITAARARARAQLQRWLQLRLRRAFERWQELCWAAQRAGAGRMVAAVAGAARGAWLLSRGGCHNRRHLLRNCDHGDSITSRFGRTWWRACRV